MDQQCSMTQEKLFYTRVETNQTGKGTLCLISQDALLKHDDDDSVLCFWSLGPHILSSVLP